MDRKPVFDAVRRLLRRGFSQSDVRVLDAAIDAAIGKPAGSSQDSVTRVTCPRRIGPDGIALIQRFEGLARQRADGKIAAYPDPGTGGAPWTIGWGATGHGIGPGTVWSREEADARLAADLERYAADVVRALGAAPTSQRQFDALVSFHYNTGAIARAILTRKHIAGDFRGAAAEFSRWNRAGGRVLAGLTRRRAAERALYETS